MNAADLFFAPQERPVPELSPENAPFFEAAAKGVLAIQQCTACGNRQHYPRRGCTRCAGTVEWIEASGRGTVHTFTIVRYTRDKPFDRLAPYVVAVVELEEGARMLSNIVTDRIDDVAIGMQVTVFFAEAAPGAGVHLPFFKPA